MLTESDAEEANAEAIFIDPSDDEDGYVDIE